MTVRLALGGARRMTLNLGVRYGDLGQTARAIDYDEQALAIAREIGARQSEATILRYLGNCYGDLGQTARAIDYYEQALAIARQTGDRHGESAVLTSLANAALNSNELSLARHQAAEAGPNRRRDRHHTKPKGGAV